ncbi:MAG: hypothetical protein ACYC4L_02005 [Chloroflexota bacterium]
MKIGLLWFDGDRKKPLLDKIEEGARCYAERFGTWPSACHSHPESVVAHPRVRVVADRHIRPNHFWLGVDEE